MRIILNTWNYTTLDEYRPYGHLDVKEKLIVTSGVMAVELESDDLTAIAETQERPESYIADWWAGMGAKARQKLMPNIIGYPESEFPAVVEAKTGVYLLWP